MRIHELVIDGFKSYAVRTVISNWDSQFNAITVRRMKRQAGNYEEMKLIRRA